MLRFLVAIFLAFAASSFAVAQTGTCTPAAPTYSCTYLSGGITYTVTTSAPVMQPVTVTAGLPPTFSLRGSAQISAAYSQYFSRTLGTPTNNKIWTFSAWMKRNSTSSVGVIPLSAAPGVSGDYIAFGGSGVGGTANSFVTSLNGTILYSTATVTDVAWHHFLVAVDSTQATAANRVHEYIDNVEVTYAGSYPAQNYAPKINSSVLHEIGAFVAAGGFYFDGEIADAHFIDGQQLTPASFVSGSGSTTTAIQYTGAFGANGWWLSFCNATHIGADDSAGAQCGYSGSNVWTPVNAPTWITDHP